MSLSSLQLDAFIEVARHRNFSAAAKAIHITQSALSQRILNLEHELGVSLFVRSSGRGVQLTATGEKFLVYCRSKDKLEEEFRRDMLSPTSELAGSVSIAGFSTFVRSRLLPILGKIKRDFPLIEVEVLTREIKELAGLLCSARVDFVFTSSPILKLEIENHLLGIEQNVLIEGLHSQDALDTYLDHDEFDRTTADFWQQQETPIGEYRRAYFDEIYSIIDAVAEGFGRAIVPIHLIEHDKRVRIVPGLNTLDVPIYLCHCRHSLQTRLQQHLIKEFTRSIPR